MRRIVAIAVMLTTLLSLSFNVMADNSTASVLVNTEIRFEIDGNEFIPRETDGSRVYPLSYNDRTYIPARFIAEAVGLEVLWDEGTQTVGFTTKNATRTNASSKQENIPQKFYVEAVINQAIKFKFDGEAFVPKEADGTILYPLTYKDRTYIPARFIMERAGIEVTWDEATQTVGFNTEPKSSETEKVDDPLSSTEKIGNGYFKSLKDVKDHVKNASLSAVSEPRNISNPEKKMQFREQALKGMILFGFNLVSYGDYEIILDEFPSYAEVYAYYMKNAKGKADAEILKHLEEIYMKPMEAIDLVPVVDVADIWDSDFATQAWCDHDKDPNQNNKYILKHLAFIDNFNLDISPLPERGLVVKNVSSGALLLDSNDSGSYYAFKINKLDSSYLEMLQYYYKQKYNAEIFDNLAMSRRTTITKHNDKNYSFYIK